MSVSNVLFADLIHPNLITTEWGCAEKFAIDKTVAQFRGIGNSYKIFKEDDVPHIRNKRMLDHIVGEYSNIFGMKSKMAK